MDEDFGVGLSSGSIEQDLAEEMGGGTWNVEVVHKLIANAPNGAFARAWHAAVFRERYIRIIADQVATPASGVRFKLWKIYNEYRVARGMEERPWPPDVPPPTVVPFP